MGEIIENQGGYLDKFIGDGTMALFGIEEGPKEGSQSAIIAATKMIDELKKLNERLIHDLPFPLKMGIGIHTGSVIAGNVGSQEMLQYSTIGDTVNVASRLEQANKDYNTDISLSHEIYTSLTKELHDQASLSGEIILKGRTSPTKVYSI